jgi:hypothetical protein
MSTPFPPTESRLYMLLARKLTCYAGNRMHLGRIIMRDLARGALLAIGFLAAFLTAALGQAYPSRTFQIVVDARRRYLR